MTTTDEPRKGSVGEPTANPTPPADDPTTDPDVDDTPQTAPDQQTPPDRRK